MTLALQAIAVVYCFILPGFLIAGRDPARPLVVRLLEGAVVSVLVLPMACFCAAWVLETNIRPPLVFAVATAFNLIGIVLLVVSGLRARRAQRRRP